VTTSDVGRVARFRQNEALRAFAEVLPGPFAFQCECSNGRCRELVLVEGAHVHAVRTNPRRLVMANGHEGNQERAVVQYDGYVIVELDDGWQARAR
jgi:hypothetical protein